LKSDGDGDESDDEELEKTVEEMQYLSKKNIFPKKVFKFGDINKSYSPIYQFYDCPTVYAFKPKETIRFFCKINKCVYNVKIGESTNLTKHLATHKECEKWLDLFSSFKGVYRRDKLSVEKLNLLKFFVSSHQSIDVLNNEWLQLLINKTVSIPSYHYFRNFFLKEVHEEIDAKLKVAHSISIIPDIWEDSGNHYLGLGCTVVFQNFEIKKY
jgi:hypothetical protein